jgi:glycosyltransferase involved in cell wall biosynthesis
MRWVRLPMVATWAKRADAIIIGCSGMLTLPVERGWKAAGNVFVIPCGVDPSYFNSDARTKRHGLLFVGSWLHRKGVQDLTESYHLLRERGYDIPLKVVGFVSTKETVLRSFHTDDRGLVAIDESKRLIDEVDLMKEYSQHEILVFPSLYEGFGMVFLEAMASGLAVVATPTGGVVDVMHHKKNGYVVSISAPLELANAIQELWDSPELCAKLGAAARNAVRELTWIHAATRTIACYEAIGRKLGRVLDTQSMSSGHDATPSPGRAQDR